MNFVELSLYLSLLIGVVATAVGVAILIKPKQMAVVFGIEASESAMPYVVSCGSRDLFIGLTVLALYFNQAWLEMGYINLFISLVSVSDFLVVRKNGNKNKSALHLLSGVVAVVYGIWLIVNF